MFKPLCGYIQAVQTRRSQHCNCKHNFTSKMHISLSLVILATLSAGTQMSKENHTNKYPLMYLNTCPT